MTHRKAAAIILTVLPMITAALGSGRAAAPERLPPAVFNPTNSANPWIYLSRGPLLQRVSLIEEGGEKRVRMAHLAIVGSHSVNGVSALHTELLRKQELRDFDQLFPGRFNNKTNGVTPRRWLLSANRPLADLISSRIGMGWAKNLEQLSGLEPAIEDIAVLRFDGGKIA